MNLLNLSKGPLQAGLVCVLFLSNLLASPACKASEPDDFLRAATSQIVEKTEASYLDFLGMIEELYRDEPSTKDALMVRFPEIVDPMALDLYQRVETLVRNEQLDLEPQERIRLAGEILELSLSTNFTASKIIEKFEVNKKAVEKGPSIDRCGVCKKRALITCPCGGHFCARHRYENEHHCTYDFKTPERKRLREANPVVQASKIMKL